MPTPLDSPSQLNNKSYLVRALLVLTTLLLFTLMLTGGSWYMFIQHHESRFYPGITIDGIKVGGLSQAEALETLESTQKTHGEPQSTITISIDDIAVASSSSELGLKREYDSALAAAMRVGRGGSVFQNASEILQTFNRGYNLSSQLSPEPHKVASMVDELKQRVDLVGREPGASLGSSNAAWSLEIDPGLPGREVKKKQTIDVIVASMTSADSLPSSITLKARVASTSSVLRDEQIEAATNRASALLGSSLVFRAEGVTITLPDTKLVGLLQLPAGYRDAAVEDEIASWVTLVNREPQNAVFEHNPETLEVTEFRPDLPGLSLNTIEAMKLLKTQLTNLETQLEDEPQVLEAYLPVTKTEPVVSLASTNNLGITELIGFGESYYDHSIPSRVHNVALTTEKISWTIVPPGQEFSFNKTLGEVSSRTGFKPAYVIKGGRTELGDGGGVCQVSTTLFRSVLDAGLQVTKRKPHSYRVSYYEQGFKPGIDATVYSGDVDLRFVNDTGNHILITGAADSENLYMTIEIYGTSDGRSTEIVDHITWDYSGPPPAQYFDDPSLPPGSIKQIDWSASGIKASFTNVVRDAEGNIIREDEYFSNYRPWSAKYLRGI